MSQMLRNGKPSQTFIALNDGNNESKQNGNGNEEHKKRRLSQHLLIKKKTDEARELREKLEDDMENERWTSALETCKKILDLRAFNFEPIYNFYCGAIYETGFHNYESAERHYRTALQLEQMNEKHIRSYARILRRLERYEQAESVYEYGIDTFPDNHYIRYEFAYLLWLSQKYQPALSQLKVCLDKDKQYQQSIRNKKRNEIQSIIGTYIV